MSPTTDPVVSIVIVNWNTSELLTRCLASVVAHTSVVHEVFVVDNASSDDSVERVRAGFPGVELIASPENVGFARANNLAIARARGEFLFVLNPDTEIQPGAVEDLVEFLRAEPRVGIAGPPLWNADGSQQSSTPPLPSLGEEFLRQTMLFHLVGNARLAQRGGDVPQVSGAALMIRRECLEDIGPLDEQIFMYYEDTDWCRRAANAGWRVAFRPGPGIRHTRGASTGGGARTHTLLASQRSAIYFFRKHHSAGTQAGFRLVTAFGSSVRILRATLEWILGRNREDQRARLAAYGSIWSWAVLGRDLGPASQRP